MGREAIGEVRRNSDGSFSTVIRTFEKRETFQLPTCTDEMQAGGRSKLLAQTAKRFRDANVNRAQGIEALRILAAASSKALRAAVLVCEELLGGKLPAGSAPQVPTFGKIAEQWTTDELAKLYPDHVKPKDHADDKSKLEYLCALDVGGVKLGELPIDSVALDHCEAAMRQLPASAKRPSTRRHYAQVIHRVLALAVYPLRVLAASPLPRGFMPKAGKPPAFSYLYPDEDARLMACGEVTVNDRVLFGFLDREGPRAGEATGLQLRDFDLERGAVKLDENKTDDPRTWALDAGVTRALRAYVERCRSDAKPTDPMFVDAEGRSYDPAKLAEPLRLALGEAGVKRTELFNSTGARGRLRAHDLRGTFVTLSLANGRTETWVADRTGHRSSAMINRYRRSARSAMELGLGALLPLDQAIPELRRLPLECHTEGGSGQRDGTQLDGTTVLSRSGGMADAADSKSASLTGVSVQVRPSVPATRRVDSR